MDEYLTLAIIITTCLLLSFPIYLFLQSIVTHFYHWANMRLEKLTHYEDPPHYHFITQNVKHNVWDYLYAVFYEYYLNVWQLFTRPLAKLHEHQPAQLPQEVRPLLLVHGFMRHGKDWRWFIKKLKKRHYKQPIFVVTLHPSNAAIEKLADCVKKKVMEIMKQTNCEHIDIIGHSMGGLVSSYYAEYLSPFPGFVRRLITLGSPLKGTRMVSLAFGQPADQMAPESRLLKSLRERIFLSQTDYYHVASLLDSMIHPWHSAILVEKKSNIYIEKNLCHLDMMHKASIINKILTWLEKD